MLTWSSACAANILLNVGDFKGHDGPSIYTTRSRLGGWHLLIDDVAPSQMFGDNRPASCSPDVTMKLACNG